MGKKSKSKKKHAIEGAEGGVAPPAKAPEIDWGAFKKDLINEENIATVIPTKKGKKEKKVKEKLTPNQYFAQDYHFLVLDNRHLWYIIVY